MVDSKVRVIRLSEWSKGDALHLVFISIAMDWNALRYINTIMQGINSWIIADILLIGYYFNALLLCLDNPFTLRARLLLIGKCWFRRYVGWISIQHCHVGGSFVMDMRQGVCVLIEVGTEWRWVVSSCRGLIEVGTEWRWVVVVVVELDNTNERMWQLCCCCIAAWCGVAKLRSRQCWRVVIIPWVVILSCCRCES